MLKSVTRSRVLKHAVSCRSVIPLCPPSSAMTSQFINTKSYRLYSTDAEEPHKRYALGLFDRLSIFQNRSDRRELKRIALGSPSNVQVISPTSKMEDDDGLYFLIYLHQERTSKDMKVSVDHGTVFVQVDLDPGRMIEKYICWVDLPDIDLQDKIFKTSDIRAEYNALQSILKLIIPKLKKDEVVYNVNIKATDDKMSCLD